MCVCVCVYNGTGGGGGVRVGPRASDLLVSTHGRRCDDKMHGFPLILQAHFRPQVVELQGQIQSLGPNRTSSNHGHTESDKW